MEKGTRHLILASEEISDRPDPEVPEKTPRRRFTAKYKLEVLKRADACTHPGELGSLLRKEGLYSSNLTTWRKQRDKGLLDAMSPKKRGRKKIEKVIPVGWSHFSHWFQTPITQSGEKINSASTSKVVSV